VRAPLTDLYLAAVERAVARRAGTWTDVRVFDAEFNAQITARCLEGGYLRAQPRDGDRPVTISGQAPHRDRRALGDMFRAAANG
jgi:hypothetical protein